MSAVLTPCLSFSPVSFPLPNPCGPRRQAQPSCGVKAGKSSPISLTVNKKRTKPPSKAGRQWHGDGGSLELPALGQGALWNFPLSKCCSLAAPSARLGSWSATHQTSAENFLQINESNQWQGSAPRQPVHKAHLSAFKLTVKPDIPLRRARRGSWHKAGRCTH